jgi:nucleotide-binding universal stress UspA family protein
MIKDILVHFDGSSEDANRLSHGLELARQYGAHLTALVVNNVPELVMAGDIGMSSARVAAELQEEAVKRGDELQKAVEAQFADLEVLNEVRRVDLQSGEIGRSVAAEVRTSDLFIMTRPYDHHAPDAALAEGVMFSSGRASYFVPPAIGPSGPIKTVVLAWRNTRESARAVAEAMPILSAADKVVVTMVSQGEDPESMHQEPGADISRHLSRHGANVELRMLTGWADPAEAILNEAERSGAQLIVMGGYGHSRFREMVLGGVTRNVLSKSDIPVLMAH